MSNHPLTDELCYQMSLENWGMGLSNDNMRSAADWQLERDAEYFAEYLTRVFGVAPEVAEIRAEWFKEAMRPQQRQEDIQ